MPNIATFLPTMAAPILWQMALKGNLWLAGWISHVVTKCTGSCMLQHFLRKIHFLVVCVIFMFNYTTNISFNGMLRGGWAKSSCNYKNISLIYLYVEESHKIDTSRKRICPEWNIASECTRHTKSYSFNTASNFTTSILDRVWHCWCMPLLFYLPVSTPVNSNSDYCY